MPYKNNRGARFFTNFLARVKLTRYLYVLECGAKPVKPTNVNFDFFSYKLLDWRVLFLKYNVILKNQKFFAFKSTIFLKFSFSGLLLLLWGSLLGVVACFCFLMGGDFHNSNFIGELAGNLESTGWFELIGISSLAVNFFNLVVNSQSPVLNYAVWNSLELYASKAVYLIFIGWEEKISAFEFFVTQHDVIESSLNFLRNYVVFVFFFLCMGGLILFFYILKYIFLFHDTWYFFIKWFYRVDYSQHLPKNFKTLNNSEQNNYDANLPHLASKSLGGLNEESLKLALLYKNKQTMFGHVGFVDLFPSYDSVLFSPNFLKRAIKFNLFNYLMQDQINYYWGGVSGKLKNTSAHTSRQLSLKTKQSVGRNFNRLLHFVSKHTFISNRFFASPRLHLDTYNFGWLNFLKILKNVSLSGDETVYRIRRWLVTAFDQPAHIYEDEELANSHFYEEPRYKNTADWYARELNSVVLSKTFRTHSFRTVRNLTRRFSWGWHNLINDFSFWFTENNTYGVLEQSDALFKLPGDEDYDLLKSPLKLFEGSGEFDTEENNPEDFLDSSEDLFYEDNFLHKDIEVASWDPEEVEIDEDAIASAIRSNSEDGEFPSLEDNEDDDVFLFLASQGLIYKAGQEADHLVVTSSKDYSSGVGLEYGSAKMYKEQNFYNFYDELADFYWVAGFKHFYLHFFDYPQKRALLRWPLRYSLKRKYFLKRFSEGRLFTFYKHKIEDLFSVDYLLFLRHFGYSFALLCSFAIACLILLACTHAGIFSAFSITFAILVFQNLLYWIGIVVIAASFILRFFSLEICVTFANFFYFPFLIFFSLCGGAFFFAIEPPQQDTFGKKSLNSWTNPNLETYGFEAASLQKIPLSPAGYASRKIFRLFDPLLLENGASLFNSYLLATPSILLLGRGVGYTPAVLGARRWPHYRARLPHFWRSTRFRFVKLHFALNDLGAWGCLNNLFKFGGENLCDLTSLDIFFTTNTALNPLCFTTWIDLPGTGIHSECFFAEFRRILTKNLLTTYGKSFGYTSPSAWDPSIETFYEALLFFNTQAWVNILWFHNTASVIDGVSYDSGKVVKPSFFSHFAHPNRNLTTLVPEISPHFLSRKPNSGTIKYKFFMPYANNTETGRVHALANNNFLRLFLANKLMFLSYRTRTTAPVRHITQDLFYSAFGAYNPNLGKQSFFLGGLAKNP